MERGQPGHHHPVRGDSNQVGLKVWELVIQRNDD
jgi:hypothetical protein